MVKVTIAAVVLCLASSAHADHAKRAAAPPPTILDVRALMTQKAQRATGIAKLSADEVDALNEWVTNLLTQFAIESEKKSGGCQIAVETSISGDFKGWEGDTVFELSNGQIWKQSEYSYEYSYGYSPSVTIYNTSSGCKMRVDGVNGAITVRRLK
jgi:hypothetical protein